ncbi:MAG: single-stranded DNA-binding protein [Clostridia bacterium]|nr:single-stranded DNA-binding protein [Clostridia bacterium]
MANFNLNKVILGGRLTANPELKQTQSGIMVTSFTIAVNRRFQSKGDDGQQTQQADFINVVAWRQQAEFVCRYFHKGSSICVVGSIQTRSWTDQQGGKRYATEVVADEVNFVDAKGENPGGGQGYAPSGAQGYMPSAYIEPQYSTPVGQAPTSQNGSAPQFEVLSDDEELPF